MTHRLTKSETAALDALGAAWNAYLSLPRQVPSNRTDDDTDDFRKAIHDAQRIVLARPAARSLRKRGV